LSVPLFTQDFAGIVPHELHEIRVSNRTVYHRFQFGNGRCGGNCLVERIHFRMTDGRREPVYDLLEWPQRDNAKSSDLDIDYWHFARSNFYG